VGKFAGTNRERNRLGDDEETNTFKVLRRREDLGGRFLGGRVYVNGPMVDGTDSRYSFLHF
jgi:hypothetical protein